MEDATKELQQGLWRNTSGFYRWHGSAALQIKEKLLDNIGMASHSTIEA